MRMIDADALKKHLLSYAGMFTDELGFAVSLQAVSNGVDFQPTIEAEPVRHGWWVDRYNGEYANPVYECSECKEAALYKHKVDALGNLYFAQALSAACPHCRAKMDGGADHADG